MQRIYRHKKFTKIILPGIKFDEKFSLRLKELFIKLPTLSPFHKLINLLQLLNELAQTDKFRILCAKDFTYPLNYDNNERINTVYQFVKDHYIKKITLKVISKQVNMSEESFSRFFSKVMRRTFFLF